MNKTFASQATALGLAAMVTFGLLASIDGLATTPAQDAVFASVPAAQVQQVVVIGQRLPRT